MEAFTAEPAGERRFADLRALLGAPAGRLLAGIAALLLIATVAATVALWPNRDAAEPTGALGGRTVAAKVVRSTTVPCGPTNQLCRRIVAAVGEGPDRGRQVTLDLGPVEATQDPGPGSGVRVVRNAGVAGAPVTYGFVDSDRRMPLTILVVAFAALGILVARRQGFLAVIGLLVSVVIITTFLVPAMLAGEPPVLVSVVASMLVMFVTLGLTYGISAQSLSAATAIAACLLLATLLGTLALAWTGLDGAGGEYFQLLSQANVEGVSLRGIILAGMVVGALGVLTDTAVTQASAVMALRRANPSLGVRGLFREGFTVGRDHLAATIHTLVMAYVGTLLPLLLVLEAADVGVTDALNGQLLAEPLVATIIGATALMASVPLTTFLTAVLAVRVPPAAIPEAHAHSH